MNPQCPRCRAAGTQVSRHGTYVRKSDSRHIGRFRCHPCRRSFSRATGTLNFGQKKRRINYPLLQLLASCVSMRACARLLGVSRNTVALRLGYLGELARQKEQRWFERCFPKADRVQLDDLITLEHTKCKPLSVCVAVTSQERYLLDLGVARIPASGSLAAISRRKYGKRKDDSGAMRRELFSRLGQLVQSDAHFDSDGHQQYPSLIQRWFPDGSHCVHPSIRGCVTGQGELKKTRFDPLFSVNHTLAMLRANVNRLVRRSWCTTKKPENLEAHLWIYRHVHNEKIRGNQAKGPVQAGSELVAGSSD